MNSQNVLRNMFRLYNACKVSGHGYQFRMFRTNILRDQSVLPDLHRWNRQIPGNKLVANISSPFRTVHAMEADINEANNAISSMIMEICNAVPAEKGTGLEHIRKRFEEVLNYILYGGKLLRLMMVPAAFKALTRDASGESIKLSYILGACIETLFAQLLILDDIMDKGITRRGKPCWFRRPEAGGIKAATNDALMVRNAVYDTLSNHFAQKSCYFAIVETFNKLEKYCTWGQILDIEATYHAKTSDISKLLLFLPEYYRNMISLKTAYCTFHVPVCLAMHLVGTFSNQDYNKCENICLRMGELFQMQDDYLDLHEDIATGKCTWFVVTALDICSEGERSVIEENYGVDNAEAVKKIHDLYTSLALEEKYHDMESKERGEIMSLISELDDNVLKRDFFISLLNTIYKRQK